MRPMPHFADTVTGAFFPRYIPPQSFGPGLPIDTRLANIPKSTVTVARAQVAGYGTMPGYGTYIEIGNTKYDTHSYWNTRPIPTITLRPQLNNPAKTVTSPAVLTKMPGYTSTVNISTTPISQMVNKPYLGSPAM